MSSEPKKTWLRPTQITRKFPENKYAFGIHLTYPGDWIETNPMTKKEAQAVQHAAWKWAWWHKYTVSATIHPFNDGWVCKVVLVKKHRNRDYT